MTDIVYKACGEYIVELKRLSDTITNEKRDGVVDSNYAKFRGNKFLVHSIKHKITKKNISEIENTEFPDKIKYIVSKEISTEFCENLNEICAKGIHFFNSFDAAYYYIDNIKNGIHKEWYENGRQSIICNYKDGKLYGDYKQWTYDGILIINYRYTNDKLDGSYNKWHYNGQQYIICNYKDGLLDGEYIQWYENGEQSKICNYKDGNIDG